MREYGFMYKNPDGTYAKVRAHDQLAPDVNGAQNRQSQNRLIETASKEKDTRTNKDYKQPF